MQSQIEQIIALALHVLFFALLFSSAFRIATNLNKTSSPPLQLCTSAIVFCWLLSIIFSVLLTIGHLESGTAILSAIFVFILTRYLWPVKKSLSAFAYRLGSFFRRILRLCRKDLAAQLILGCFLVIFFLLAVRSLALPLLGWDSLTYHALKAGLWVQSGTHYTLEAPGDWESYRTFLGGGEAFTALSMLFMRNDLFAGTTDFFFWVFLGVTIFCLARELNYRTRAALIFAGAFLSTPELMRVVGSGYVDSAATAFLLSGLLFTLQLARQSKVSNCILTAASLGLAGSVKINALATGIFMLPCLLFVLVWRKAASVKHIAAVLLLFVAPVLPWLYFNYMTSGFPLGCTPLKIGGITIGQMPPSLAWFFDQPALKPYSLASEAVAIIKSLEPLGLLSLLVFLAGFGVMTGLKSANIQYLICCYHILIVMGLYFSPSFSLIRIAWAHVSGRFIVSAVIPLTLLGLRNLRQNRNTCMATSFICLAAVPFGLLRYYGLYIQNSEMPLEKYFLPVAVLATLTILALVRYNVKEDGFFRKHRFAAVLAGLIVIVVFGAAKSACRIDAYEKATIFRSFPRHWIPALRALNQEQTNKTIAFAYGPRQIHHEAFLAPFLGKTLNNRLQYISPLAQGGIPVYQKERLNSEDYDYEIWLSRLIADKVTHLLCLRPLCEELRWAESNPERFEPLAGEPEEWGLFKLLPRP